MNIFENIDVVAADNRNIPIVLGIQLMSGQDHLMNRRDLEFSTKEQWTQWQVLYTISQVYDPLRFLAPSVIRGRLLLKRIWQT